MHVLGTAGHVDHGKSSLVRALSGIDPDRLPEEKARGLTIDLGFAWFETPSGPLGVVDVPGHERFVRTMVAGAGGIDIVILVIAADDGWMPQTQEHLDILRLLDVRTGVIALSKVDLVETSWADLVAEDIREKTRGTFLEGAPIVRTDAVSGKGIDELKTAIAAAQERTAERGDLGRARLAIDRVFTMTGQGTVVTGTLRDGELKRDQEVYVFPLEERGRVRALQTHKHSLDVARPGSRVAANLAGVDKAELRRGHWIYAEPPQALPRFVGVHLEILPNAPFALKARSNVLVIFGTTEAEARLVVADGKAVPPGAQTIAQLQLLEPLSARFGDRFVLRLPSPQFTVGGGRFLAPTPHRYGRRHAHLWDGLRRLADGRPADWIDLQLLSQRFVSRGELYPFFPGSRNDFQSVLDEGESAGRWQVHGEQVIGTAWWTECAEEIKATVLEYHREHPSEVGPASAELFSTVRIPVELQAGMLASLSAIGVHPYGPHVCHESHRAGLTPAQERLAESWRARFAATPYAGPTRPELLGEGRDARSTLEYMLKSDELVELKDGILVRKADFDRAVRLALEQIRKDGELTVATFRKLIDTSRKYALPILDSCDRLGYTRRAEDRRVLGPRASELLEQTSS